MPTLFQAYCIGMTFAALCAWGYRRAFSLRLFYALVIVVAHYALVPRSHDLGRQFYEYCGFFQFLVMLFALWVGCLASLPVALLAFCACVLNVLSYYNYPAHTGIWRIYYAGINTVQTLQIASLIFLSPMSLRITRWYTRKLKRDGGRTWTLLQLEM